jgi:nitrite reductase/ring-hydroxylating ferredoxin subunit
MGDYFRRFWLPVLLACELPEPDAPPVRVTVLGEPLVAFRDSERRVGLLDPRCPHRGAKLFFGRNEDEGLRCAYHGWKFDGRVCLDLPTLPPEPLPRPVRRVPHARVGRRLGLPRPARLCPPSRWSSPSCPRASLRVQKLQQCNWAQAARAGSTPRALPPVPVDVPDNAPAAVKWMRDDSRGSPGRPTWAAIGPREADGALYWRIAQYVPNHACARFPGENIHGRRG